MPIRFGPSVDWINDLSIHVDDKELLEHVAILEAAVLPRRSRAGTAAWMVLVSVIAGAVAGLTWSHLARSSWAIFGASVGVAALFLRVLKPVTARLLGEDAGWHAFFAGVWSFALATVAVVGGRIDTAWLATIVVVGGGLLIGLMQVSVSPGLIRQRDGWLIAALPLGALSTWSAAGLQRAFDGSTNPVWSETYVGIMAASVFMAPMALLAALLSTRSNGLATLAALYLHNDHFLPKAVECLDEAIALSPKSADLFNLRGIAHSKSGHSEQADADFARVSALSPRAAEGHMNRAVDLARRGNVDGAIEALTYATTINPKHATAFSNLGTAYQRKRDFAAAIASYDRAISLRPNYPVAFANRAYAHYLNGAYDSAIADASRAIALAPRLPMAHVNLAHALAATGNVVMAASSFRQALALHPDQSVASEALEALEKLGIGAPAPDAPAGT